MNWIKAINNYKASFEKNGKVYIIDLMGTGHYRILLNGDSVASGFVAGGPEVAMKTLESFYDKEYKVVESHVDDSVESEPDIEEPDPDPSVSPIMRANDDGTVTVELVSNVEDSVIKYTTNGKDVISSSKIYREPFTVNKGIVINAVAFANKVPVAKLSNYLI